MPKDNIYYIQVRLFPEKHQELIDWLEQKVEETSPMTSVTAYIVHLVQEAYLEEKRKERL